MHAAERRARGLLARPTLEAAHWLLGATLVREDVGGRRAGRIVEVEAYVGIEDRASHARFGETARNRVMFGPPGRAYVYLVYGMHDCLNVVTEPEGRPAALLVRAVEPVDGLAAMRTARVEHAARRRAVAGHPEVVADVRRRLDALPDARLASGPGLVAAAFSIGRGDSGADLLDPRAALRLELPAKRLLAERLATSARIGVGYAPEPWRSVRWRFYDAMSPSVSGRDAAPGSR